MYIDLVLQETSWETILVSDHWILALVRGDRLREVRLYLLIKKENIFPYFISIHSISVLIYSNHNRLCMTTNYSWEQATSS